MDIDVDIDVDVDVDVDLDICMQVVVIDRVDPWYVCIDIGIDTLIWIWI